MRRLLATAIIFVAVPLLSQPTTTPVPPTQPQPASGVTTSQFPGVEFSWPQEPNGKPMPGFGHTPTPEVGRYDTLNINVTPAFTADAARQLGGSAASPLVTELASFTELAKSLKTYTDALSKAVAAHPQNSEAVLQDANFKSAARSFGLLELQFAQTVKPIDPDLYRVVSQTFIAGGGYKGVALGLQQGIDALNARLQSEIGKSSAFGMTATIIPLEADARVLHLPGYDTNTQLAVAAVPNLIPVVDMRTQAELNAAQTLADTTMQLAQVPAEAKKTIADAQASLDDLKKQLTQDLDKNLAAVQQAIEASGRTDLGSLLTEVTAARQLVQSLNSANPTLAGTTDAERLLNLANTLNTTVDALTAAFTTLPSDLKKLAADVDTAVKNGAIQLDADVTKSIKDTADAFLAKQTFFLSLRDNLKKLGDQFAPNSLAVMSAERLQQTARSIDTNTNLSTSLDLSRISGDMHVQDRIEIDAGLYRRDAGGNLQAISEGHQQFVIERYGVYPDNVRGGLIFVEPRSKIERNISYQPTVALGYYWRYGIEGHPGWNANSPSFGFTMSLLDFQDSSNLEIGIAGGVSLLRDLLWVGYGRNLQAKANYFYVGVNALALGKMIVNRTPLR